jgi:hypothetical protein
MQPRIKSGQLVTVEPINRNPPQVGEAVLCWVTGAQYVHLVVAVQGERCLIGNNKGRTNGWTNMARVYGRVTKVED